MDWVKGGPDGTVYTTSKTSHRLRSARVLRFRYGESLTSEACLKRTREEASKNQQKKNTKEKKTKKKKTDKNDFDYNESNNTLCPNCGGCRNIGDQWVCCDVCDIWYHLKCTTITELDNVKVMEWKCSDCSKPL
ncbi:uncharacterized protein LOC124816246 [Hydra vulgaris]|uniref:uncharacterized protein LOC124816246 n=1 Tax=Hydra vulgaris TaxID=6087 RepID=UPI0032E9C934